MTPDDFRQRGRDVVDWVANYRQQVEQYPVLSTIEPGWVRSQLPDHAPQQPEPFDDILADVDRIILPGITHWQSPNFFAFFPANNSGPSILGELLSAGLGVQGMLWATSPACTELETHVLDWLVDILGLPGRFHSGGAGGGVIQDTASSATLCALIAARERATGFQTRRTGVRETLTAYASLEAHSSVEKAMQIAGLGADQLRLIDVDDELAMKPEDLARAIEQDLAGGNRPCFVCATVGTTSTQAIDPLAKIGPICAEHNLWLHVDAAMSGTAAVCPEYRHLHDGLDAADSYCVNPHKWMAVNFDCDCFWVADRQALTHAMSIDPEYLKNRSSQSGKVIDYRDWQIPLGRRFRALKLWFTIRHFGVEGIQQQIRSHVEMTQWFAEHITSDDRFELMAPVGLTLVCFRHRDGDESSERLLTALNDSGKVFLTHTRVRDQFTLRMSIGQATTEQHHVEEAWRLISELA